MTITWLDEEFGHQLVAPRTQVAHPDDGWAERHYFLVTGPDGLILNAGRQLYPHRGERRAFVSVRAGDTLHAATYTEPLGATVEPDAPVVGAVGVTALEPLRRLRITLAGADVPVAVDLVYQARFPPVATSRNVIKQGEVTVTDYMNFFQSGTFTGQVRIGAQTLELRAHGFRDRGWGLRKHEGAPRRGLVACIACELPDQALYALLFEDARGRRRLTDGWLMGADGVTDMVEGVEHELEFAGQLLTGGEFGFSFRSGRTATLRATVRSALFLSAVGYAAAGPPVSGYRAHDLRDAAVADRLAGQTDHATAFTLDGVAGYGYVETGLGVHARYRADGDAAG